MHLNKYKKGYSLISVLFVFMIITIISALSSVVVINNKRQGIEMKYIDLYNLGELDEILPEVNLYLKKNHIKDTIKDGVCRNINNELSIIYSKNLDKVQVNYIYNGASKGRFFRYKFIEEEIMLLPEEGKYE